MYTSYILLIPYTLIPYTPDPWPLFNKFRKPDLFGYSFRKRISNSASIYILLSYPCHRMCTFTLTDGIWFSIKFQTVSHYIKYIWHMKSDNVYLVNLWVGIMKNSIKYILFWIEFLKDIWTWKMFNALLKKGGGKQINFKSVL